MYVLHHKLHTAQWCDFIIIVVTFCWFIYSYLFFLSISFLFFLQCMCDWCMVCMCVTIHAWCACGSEGRGWGVCSFSSILWTLVLTLDYHACRQVPLTDERHCWPPFRLLKLLLYCVVTSKGHIWALFGGVHNNHLQVMHNIDWTMNFFHQCCLKSIIDSNTELRRIFSSFIVFMISSVNSDSQGHFTYSYVTHEEAAGDCWYCWVLHKERLKIPIWNSCML